MPLLVKKKMQERERERLNPNQNKIHCTCINQSWKIQI